MIIVYNEFWELVFRLVSHLDQGIRCCGLFLQSPFLLLLLLVLVGVSVGVFVLAILGVISLVYCIVLILTPLCWCLRSRWWDCHASL